MRTKSIDIIVVTSFLLALQASKQRVMGQIEDGIKQIPPSTQISTASFALIIDGKSLTYALEDEVPALSYAAT